VVVIGEGVQYEDCVVVCGVECVLCFVGDCDVVVCGL